MAKQVRMVASGQVQGVNFRAYTRSVAQRLGLMGYVRNLPDGDVEVVAEGEEDRLNELIAWARHGPPAAHVQDIQVVWAEPSGSFSDFEVRF